MGDIQPSIQFGKVPIGSVKWEISPNRDTIVSNHTREVNKGICSQSNASAYARIFMQVLQFHLLQKTLSCPHETYKFKRREGQT